MSFEPREFLRHILADAIYLETSTAALTQLVRDVVQRKIPSLRAHLTPIIDAG